MLRVTRRADVRPISLLPRSVCGGNESAILDRLTGSIRRPYLPGRVYLYSVYFMPGADPSSLQILSI